jgi:gliding motility-associated-like protein
MTNSTGIFSGIPAGTGYAWSITDAGSCGPVAGTLDVTEPQLLTGSASVTAAILCNGGTATVTLTGTGGTLPLSYTFSGVTNSTGIFSGIAAGTGYSWSITDANNCGPVTGTVDIAEPLTVTGSASVTTEITCNGGTATVTLTGGGGTSPFTYTFNGVTNSTGIFTGLPAQTGYLWSINDVSSCGPATGILDIAEPESITGSAAVTKAIACNGGTAEVTMTGTGGTGPLSYTFNGVTNTTGIFSGIAAGTGYAWSITDPFNCGPLAGTLDIAEPTAVSGTIVSQTNVSVIGGNDGSVIVEGLGGTLPYLYKFNSGAYQVSGTFGSLSAGSYTVTVQDAALCESVVPVNITEPYLPLTGTIISQTDSLCFGENTGSVSVAGAEGVPPYDYSLNGGTYQTSGTFNSLTAGMYDITIRDAVSNSVNIPFTIAQPAEALSVITDKTNNLCNGDFKGTATATAAGGAAPYEYSWNTTPVQAEATATGLRPGTYTVTVTDAIGCTTSAEVTITEPPALSVNATPSDAACPDSNDGSIILDIAGGTAPYSQIWSDGITTRNRTAVLPGNYVVVVTDANGCGKSANAMVGFVGSFGCLVIPQVITPNNDGYNDEWIIRNIDIYPNAEILIFTRWGKLIYRTRNISADPWDGRSDGRLMPTDSYHYILYLNDGSEPRSGVISVIR